MIKLFTFPAKGGRTPKLSCGDLRELGRLSTFYDFKRIFT